MWAIEFFTFPSGKSPISDFISSLQKTEKAKTSNCLDLLTNHGPNLREPHSKKLAGFNGLFELRTSDSSPVRLIYYRIGQKYIILHGFIKKSNKTPTKELRIAIKRTH